MLSQWEMMTKTLIPGLSFTLSYAPFSVADLNLYFFAVINCNHEFNTLLSSMSPSKSLNLRVVLQTTDADDQLFCPSEHHDTVFTGHLDSSP